MGHKIITEEDFWVCSEGAMPSPFQGTRTSNKTPNGDVYITVEDTSTISWIDFGCKKYMILMAIAAAVAVVVAIAVGVLTVATGGAALLVLGLVAGVAGGVIGAVVGGMLCGHKMGPARKWLGSKSNFISTGTKTITGEHQMECKAGGIVKYAPNIKSWLGAIGYASLSYGGELVKCAFMGMGIVGLTPLIVGGSSAGLIGGGGFTLTRASTQLAWPTFSSVGRNVLMSFGRGTGSRLLGTSIIGSRGIFGAESAAYTYATDAVDENGNPVSIADSFAKGALPEYELGSRLHEQGLSGLQPSDAMFLLYFLNVKTDPPGTYRDKNGELRNAKDNPRGQKTGSFAKDPRKTKTGKGKGKAYEANITSQKKGAIAEKAAIDKLKADGYTDVLQIQNKSGHGVDIIARNPKTGNVKVVEVKANTSRLSADQSKGGEWFTESRLNRAQRGKGHWKVPPNDTELPKNANKAQEWINDAPQVNYEVHQVDVNNTTGQAGTPNVSDW